MLATLINDIVKDGRLQKGSIIHLMNICNIIQWRRLGFFPILIFIDYYLDFLTHFHRDLAASVFTFSCQETLFLGIKYFFFVAPLSSLFRAEKPSLSTASNFWHLWVLLIFQIILDFDIKIGFLLLGDLWIPDRSSIDVDLVPCLLI